MRQSLQKTVQVERAIVPQSNRICTDHRSDGECAVDMGKPFLSTIVVFDSDFGENSGGIDHQEHNISSTLIDEVSDRPHLTGKGTMDEPFLGERPTEGRSGVRLAQIDRFGPLCVEGQVVDQIHGDNVGGHDQRSAPQLKMPQAPATGGTL